MKINWFWEVQEKKGNWEATDSAIDGNVKRGIKVSGNLYLHETAKMDGIIITEKMTVDSGAFYTGGCRVGDQYFK
ncbi:polymer-forming cytoskeletal protein [Saprospiraceae bacterium]|nr:polymer-forming cytoskeletal protein [Saprospiraceae bacterium]MDC3219505.1 polymer-forming cytoskeletal protein [Saprospiraceae bacterium]